MDRVVRLTVGRGRDADRPRRLLGVPLHMIRIQAPLAQNTHQLVTQPVVANSRHHQPASSQLVGMPGKIRRSTTGTSAVGEYVPEHLTQANENRLDGNVRRIQGIFDRRHVKDCLGFGEFWHGNKQPRLAVETKESHDIELPGKDSNLERQDQNLLCYLLHHRVMFP